MLMVLAHQGEEFVLILPAAMLVGAFLIMRWAAQPEPGASDSDLSRDGERGGGRTTTRIPPPQ